MRLPLTRRRFLGRAAAAVIAAPYIARAAATTGFEIGLVADPQYANIKPLRTRFYREGRKRLEDAIEHFNGRDLAFCVNLGDLIDREWKSFDAMLTALRRSRHRWQHLLGNHDFEVPDESKRKVAGRLGLSAPHSSFDHAGFRFVVWDTNDVSIYAHALGTMERADAEKELERVKAEKRRQAQRWNGAVGPAQLAWFEMTCAAAQSEQKKVIVLAHHPVAPEGNHNVWNTDEVLAAVDRHPNIVAWFNGHNHAGAFAERNGIPYVTMRGMVETATTTAFATAKILPDRMLLTGHGREPSRELVFRPT